MIDIKANGTTREMYVENIMMTFGSATPDQESRGRWWYSCAHDLANLMADGNTKVGAGLLAALSPQTSWEYNIELACDAYDTGRPTRHVGDALSKATRILAGIPPEEVLPMERKTGHFYRCILNPVDPDAVCIDRHAHDVAVGTAYGSASRGLDAHGRYNLIASCYREAARRLGELPQVVQAVTWVTWRDGS